MAVIHNSSIGTVGSLEDSCGVNVPIGSIARQFNHQCVVVLVCELQHVGLPAIAVVPLTDYLIVPGYLLNEIQY